MSQAEKAIEAKRQQLELPEVVSDPARLNSKPSELRAPEGFHYLGAPGGFQPVLWR
jgi:hypothetical protein